MYKDPHLYPDRSAKGTQSASLLTSVFLVKGIFSVLRIGVSIMNRIRLTLLTFLLLNFRKILTENQIKILNLYPLHIHYVRDIIYKCKI